jgi:hypothetical protein
MIRQAPNTVVPGQLSMHTTHPIPKGTIGPSSPNDIDVAAGEHI